MPDRKFDGGDASRIEALEAENERLRLALGAARDKFKLFGYRVYSDACDTALEHDRG